MTSILMGPGGIGSGGVTSVYLFENPHKWFATLSSAAHIQHYQRIHGTTFQLQDSELAVTIEHLEKEKSKGVIYWIPPTMTITQVQNLAQTITGDPKTEVTKITSAPDKWSFTYKPTPKRIPHHAKINIHGENEESQSNIWITLPGRRTQCATCGQDTHWSSQCPLGKRQNPKLAVRLEKSPTTMPSKEGQDPVPPTLEVKSATTAATFPPEKPPTYREQKTPITKNNDHGERPSTSHKNPTDNADMESEDSSDNFKKIERKRKRNNIPTVRRSYTQLTTSTEPGEQSRQTKISDSEQKNYTHAANSNIIPTLTATSSWFELAAEIFEESPQNIQTDHTETIPDNLDFVTII
uniref:CCHC-type domain-containing protein n=1 Tax=Arion vulgaris TaxID=1028688 RepID=A0A0B7B6G3_9EUPU